MPNPLIEKLSYGADLTEDDRLILADLVRHTRRVGPRTDLIQQGDRPEVVYLILEGLACRYKVLRDGSRQNMAFLVPGDFCDLHIAILDVMDHGISTVSACTVVDIPRRTIIDLTDNYPRIARALWWCTLVDEGTLREWVVNLGQRDADHRMAHLFCELRVRLGAVGLARDDSYELPVIQQELAETLGMTAVHANRTLQTLRDDGLISFRGKRLIIHDVARLEAYCDFNPMYLHLTRRTTSGATALEKDVFLRPPED